MKCGCEIGAGLDSEGLGNGGLIGRLGAVRDGIWVGEIAGFGGV